MNAKDYILEGCETYAHWRENDMFLRPENYFAVGMRANKKDFEYLTHCIGSEDLDGMINTKLHTGVSQGIKKGQKVKYKGGLVIAHNIVRFRTEECEYMPEDDVVGNVFIQTIITRYIHRNIAADTAELVQKTIYIDRFGNTWKLLNDNGDVELIKVGDESFNLYSYCSKPFIIYNDEFTYKDYLYWCEHNNNNKIRTI